MFPVHVLDKKKKNKLVMRMRLFKPEQLLFQISINFQLIQSIRMQHLKFNYNRFIFFKNGLFKHNFLRYFNANVKFFQHFD